MCVGRHKYAVEIQTTGVDNIVYPHRTYRACVKHLVIIGVKHRQDKLRLSRWYQCMWAKALIRRSCP